ncbi:thiamine-phosphate diphosphorylase [Listeria newyorkensis]|uniref:Thiamine-phosphate synthase n=1 Tax=Listeria newyorkensis TaxID=1497681 RepID=A0ABX4XQD4_9LIST|nr:thiamine phosphate synthase [Listeria newyorkensis]KGL46150.1 thiamine-phosphate pyrophosphorylase [Listeria newyorkensis]KMT62909.1 thiamine-phosphate pyrophosphorylase [Listeria newyorkensis]PNP94432.1 thiamine-phosphate diphosphorylase [Listeria newyorkensis]WAO22845.1 thiamine phosphate synthase [Listeria newyorkensis]SQC58710.1 Thiamine-phosphate synthase [Listeria newyorkensis]
MSVRDMLEIYFIAGTQDVPRGQLLSVLDDALQSGVTCYQFREKALTEAAEIEVLAKLCQEICQKYGVPFFVNDDVELALKIGADGIHVGQDDMAILDVIGKCAGKMKIGLSVNTLAQAEVAATYAELDYIGVGPIFATTSKLDAKPTTGLRLIRDIREAGIGLPIVAIGGISQNDVESIRDAGAEGVAVISEITKSGNIPQTIASFR